MCELTRALERISEGARLRVEESQHLFARVIGGELEAVQIAALLIALKTRGEQVDEIVGAAQAMREHAKSFNRPDYLFADNCGTGGDGAGTVNVSTAAAFVAAELGIPVAKHGNRSVSSSCGSADLLEACGVNLRCSAKTARRCLDETGVCFLFAPDYHAGVRHAMDVRQSLKTRTLFNLLGPLVNPAKPPMQLLGVYHPRWVEPLAKVLAGLGCESALVVHGSGLDEIAVHDSTQVSLYKRGKLKNFALHPEELGISRFPLQDLRGGGPEDNAQWLQSLLSGRGEPAHKAAVALNAGVLAWLADRYADIPAAVQAALRVLDEGSAMQRLEALRETSHAG